MTRQHRNRLLTVGIVTILLLSVYAAWSELRPIFFGARAHDVPSTFLRMSPELQLELERYQDECYGNSACNTRVYFVRRDAIIARDWPRVYDYLSKPGNWGGGRLTRPNKDAFFHEIAGFTPSRLRNEWVPVLQYDDGELVLGTCDSTQNDKRRYVPTRTVAAGLCK